MDMARFEPLSVSGSCIEFVAGFAWGIVLQGFRRAFTQTTARFVTGLVNGQSKELWRRDHNLPAP